MESKKSMNSDTPSEFDACSNQEKVPTDIIKIKIQETCNKNESEQQSNEISKKKEDAEDKPDYLHAMSKPKDYLQVKALTEGKKQKIGYSSLKEKRKNKKQETVSVTKRQRTISLRRRVLETMTKRKSLLEFNKSIEFPDENNKSESENFQHKEPKNSEQKNEGTGKGSLGSSATNSSILEEFPSNSTPSHRFKKVSTNKNQSLCSTQTTPATAPHDNKLKSEKEVWAHFISFLQNNNEEPSEIVPSDVRKDNMELLISATHSLKDAVEESTCQSLRKTVGTKTKYVTPETLDTLKSEILVTQEAYSEYITKKIQEQRINMVKYLTHVEDYLIRKKIKALEEKDVQMKIQCLTDTQDKQKKFYQFFNILCDHQILFDILQQHDSTKNILSTQTCLTDLPLSAAHVKSFYLLFLYQHKSLYYETEIENIYKRINLDRYFYHQEIYMERKEIFEEQTEDSENIAVKLSDCFKVSLRECRLKMKREISHSGIMSLEDCQVYISDLKAAIKKNLICLNELLSVGSSTLFPVVKYVSESQKRTLLDLYFLDNRRRDVFLEFS